MAEGSGEHAVPANDDRNRRRIRFSLRSALVIMALVATACWIYWHGWPWYNMYRAQLEFEEIVKQEFRPGQTVYESRVFGGLKDTLVGYGSDSQGKTVAFVCRVWPNNIYVIYGPHKKGSGAAQESAAFDGVEVFRLDGLPAGYSPQTERGRRAWQRYQPGHWGSKALQAYLFDFIEMIKGDRRDELGFQYELLHNVPAVER